MAELATAEITTLPAVATRKPQEVRVVTDQIPILDTARFEHMQRIANVMARCALIPDGLKADDAETTVANAFLVVNQAVRWGMDPFAVAQCASVIHGKLCYEGKLVAAVMQKSGVNLEFELSGAGEAMKVIVRGTLPGETKPREISGTVANWKTGNEQWKKDPAAMLCYRGARAWSRIHNPAPMLGVYTPDELEELGEEIRGARARDVTPPAIPAPESRPAAVATQPEQVEWTDPPESAAAPTPPPIPPKTDPLDIPPGLDRRAKPAPVEATAADVFDPAQWLKDLDAAFSGCEDMMSLGEEWTRLAKPHEKLAFPPDWTKAKATFRTHEARIGRTNRDAG